LQANVNAPHIDPKTQGVAGAVLFLRGVNPARARPWHHPPVQVELRDYQFHLMQGSADGHIGFIHRGDGVRIVSRQNVFHAVHAQGAAFFSYTFPDPEQPLSRPLNHCGVVELTSAAGYYWMRAYLFVDDQPYYARTDAQGRFRLEEVPVGTYEIICWMPSWLMERHEREPEGGLVVRHFFKPPIECGQPVSVHPKQTSTIDFSVSRDLWVPKQALTGPRGSP
jgi:hypothetical protein